MTTKNGRKIKIAGVQEEHAAFIYHSKLSTWQHMYLRNEDPLIIGVHGVPFGLPASTTDAESQLLVLLLLQDHILIKSGNEGGKSRGTGEKRIVVWRGERGEVRK